MASAPFSLSLDRVRAHKDTLRLLEYQKQQLLDARARAVAAFDAASRDLNNVTSAYERVCSQHDQIRTLVDSEICAIHGGAMSNLPQDILRAVFVELATGKTRIARSRTASATGRGLRRRFSFPRSAKPGDSSRTSARQSGLRQLFPPSAPRRTRKASSRAFSTSCIARVAPL